MQFLWCRIVILRLRCPQQFEFRQSSTVLSDLRRALPPVRSRCGRFFSEEIPCGGSHRLRSLHPMKKSKKKPYSERTDREKLETNWGKTLKLMEREEYSMAIVRAATCAEIATNIVIRTELTVIRCPTRATVGGAGRLAADGKSPAINLRRTEYPPLVPLLGGDRGGQTRRQSAVATRNVGRRRQPRLGIGVNRAGCPTIRRKDSGVQPGR